MRRRSSSATGRYFLARLRPLGRPIFWGPAIALLLLLLFTWDWWTRPEGTAQGERSDEEVAAREEQAIGADIDSLPVLINDIGIKSETNKAKPDQPALPQPGGTNAPRTPASPPANASTGLLTTQSTLGQPGIFGAFNNGLADRYGQSNTGESSAISPERNSVGTAQPSGSGGGFGAAIQPTVSSKSPLQEAMTRLYATPSPATPTNVNPSTQGVNQTPIPVEGTTRLDSPGIDATKPSPTGNAYTNLVEGSQPYSPPANYPATVAPPVASPSIGPNSNLPPLNLANPVGQPAVPAQPSPVGSVYGSPASLPELKEQPFSAPRQLPGRSIGGGNINTFSNP